MKDIKVKTRDCPLVQRNPNEDPQPGDVFEWKGGHLLVVGLDENVGARLGGDVVVVRLSERERALFGAPVSYVTRQTGTTSFRNNPDYKFVGVADELTVRPL